MQREAEPDPESSPPGVGLRALAVLVAEALARILGDTRPALATPAGPLGALVANANVHAETALGTPASIPRSARTDESPPTGIRDEHAATWQLVARAKDGDGDAFGQLYDSYVDMVYRFIYFRVNDR